MELTEVPRAIEAALEIAASLDLQADEAILLHNSNKLALRLLPCDVFARVAPVGTGLTRFEIDLALRLAGARGPVAELEPRVDPRPYERHGFEASLWTYYERLAPTVAPMECAHALADLHAAMRTIDTAVTVPHYTDRLADTHGNIGSQPRLDAADRELLGAALRDLGQAVADRGAPEQPLHGEPHAGNVLATAVGPRFIDLETCCRGPVEFDLAHAPSAAGEHYPGADQALLEDCRGLVLAVVAKNRCDPGDELPSGERALHALLNALRTGPPWPGLDTVMPPVSLQLP